jgi:hypothetical protein
MRWPYFSEPSQPVNRAFTCIRQLLLTNPERKRGDDRISRCCVKQMQGILSSPRLRSGLTDHATALRHHGKEREKAVGVVPKEVALPQAGLVQRKTLLP